MRRFILLDHVLLVDDLISIWSISAQKYALLGFDVNSGHRLYDYCIKFTGSGGAQHGLKILPVGVRPALGLVRVPGDDGYAVLRTVSVDCLHLIGYAVFGLIVRAVARIRRRFHGKFPLVILGLRRYNMDGVQSPYCTVNPRVLMVNRSLPLQREGAFFYLALLYGPQVLAGENLPGCGLDVS